MKVKAIGEWSMGAMSATDGQELNLPDSQARDLKKRGYVQYETKVVMPSPTAGPMKDATSSHQGRQRKTKTSPASKDTDE